MSIYTGGILIYYGQVFSFKLLSPPILADLPTLPLFHAGSDQEV